MGAYAMSQSEFNQETQYVPRDFRDVITRIDGEIQLIDKQLKNLKRDVEQDLRELFDTQITTRTTSFEAFRERHLSRLTNIKSDALKKAKGDLLILKQEILSATSR